MSLLSSVYKVHDNLGLKLYYDYGLFGLVVVLRDQSHPYAFGPLFISEPGATIILTGYSDG